MQFNGINSRERSLFVKADIPEEKDRLFIHIQEEHQKGKVSRSNDRLLKQVKTIARQIFGNTAEPHISIELSPKISIKRKSFNFFGFSVEKVQPVPLLFFRIKGTQEQKRQFLIELGIDPKTLKETESLARKRAHETAEYFSNY